jgi:ionotropic glutamate receptor
MLLSFNSPMFLQAFPQGSPLLPNISRAILNVTEDKDKLGGIEKYISSTPCEDQSATISSQSSSLDLYNFGGLFIITVVASTSSLLVYLFIFLHSHWPALNASSTDESSFGSKLLEMIKHFDRPQRSLLASPGIHPSIN